jgi:hypothetical protein
MQTTCDFDRSPLSRSHHVAGIIISGQELEPMPKTTLLSPAPMFSLSTHDLPFCDEGLFKDCTRSIDEFRQDKHQLEMTISTTMQHHEIIEQKHEHDTGIRRWSSTTDGV